MKEIKIDGQLQVTAGAILLQESGLLKWAKEDQKFQPIPNEEFENRWRKKFHPVFGRLISWIIFSAGAEFLAKGVCLLRNIEIREEHNVPTYPSGNIYQWAKDYTQNWKSYGTIPVTHFGTLGKLLPPNNSFTGESPLEKLWIKVEATEKQKNIVFASYDFLRRNIRNRDAHAYVPNVRESHHSFIPKLFSESVNLFISWIPGDKNPLPGWINNPGKLINN